MSRDKHVHKEGDDDSERLLSSLLPVSTDYLLLPLSSLCYPTRHLNVLVAVDQSILVVAHDHHAQILAVQSR